MAKALHAGCALLLAGCLAAPEKSGVIDGGVEDEDAAPVIGRAWDLRNPTAFPSGLFGHRMAYHARLGGVGGTVLYGGSKSGTNGMAQATMWSWDGENWDVLCDSCAPGPRMAHGLVYDEDADRLLLFGGIDDTGTILGDLWSWTEGGGWTPLEAGGTPPGPHRSFWMARDDDRDTVVMYGGKGETGVRNDQLFELDSDDNWTELGGIQPPGVRSDTAAASAWAPGLGVLVYGDEEPTDDLWAWDGEMWRRPCEECTGRPRHAAVVAYDAGRRRTLIVGGWDGSTEIDGTWEITDDGTACTVDGPAGRDTGAMTYDASLDAFVYFGGNGSVCEGNCEETLEYTPSQSPTCMPAPARAARGR